jgi:AraC-like DNA-binding protein
MIRGKQIRSVNGRPANLIHVRDFATTAEVLVAMGFDPAPLLARAELPVDLFDRHEQMVDYGDFVRFLTVCIEATGREDFGLDVGRREGLLEFGLSGVVMMNCEMLQEALELLITGIIVRSNRAGIKLERRAGAAVLSYLPAVAHAPASDHLSDAAMAIGCNLIRELIGSDWKPTEVCLTRRRPVAPRPFSTFFGPMVRYSCPSAALVFSEKDLLRPVVGHNVRIKEILLPLLLDGLAQSVSDPLSDIRSLARRIVLDGPLTLKRTAAALGKNERALSRLLQDHGARFSDLSDEIKFETARRLLVNKTPIVEVAVTLHYADPAAFTRAFKKWSGRTPREWRREALEHIGGGGGEPPFERAPLAANGF